MVRPADQETTATEKSLMLSDDKRKGCITACRAMWGGTRAVRRQRGGDVGRSVYCGPQGGTG